MGDEDTKLFASKPKKSKLKASTMASSSSAGATGPPLPQHLKVSSRSPYRILVPLVLALNFSIGAYVLVKTKLRDERVSEEDIPEEPTSSTSTSTSIREAQITTTNSRGSTA